MIKRIINTLNQFEPLNFYEVGEFDINCEHIRNEEMTVLIYVYPQEIKIKLRIPDAIEYKEQIYNIITIPMIHYKTFTSLMCIVFATIKEYYDRYEIPKKHKKTIDN